MKSFHQFQEDSTSDTQAAIGSPGGNSSAPNIKNKFNTFKKRPKTGIARAAWDKSRELGKGAVDKIKGRLNRPKPTNDGPGEQPAREPNTYRQKSQQKQLPPGAEKRALPPSKEKRSMVQQRTAAANQPPQHKQIDARPASTAMAGSRQRPAIRPGTEKKALPQGKSNLSRDNQGVQNVNVRVEPQKALPPGGATRQRIAAQPQRKALPPGRG